MKLKYFDIHSHLNFSQFDEGREEIIEKMKEEGVFTITVGTDKKTSKEAVDLARKHENLYATIGVHPTSKDDWDAEYFENLLKTSNKIVGVGECGLDYFRIKGKDDEEKIRQKELFIEQIKFGQRNDLPLMFHLRSRTDKMDAHKEALTILESYKGKIRGDFHFCTDNVKIAGKFLDLGHYLSFDGPITFAREYEGVIKKTPIEKIMAETDAPFAAPVPYRGKRNNPLYVKEIYEKIAQIKSLDFEEVRTRINQNSLDFWNIELNSQY